MRTKSLIISILLVSILAVTVYQLYQYFTTREWNHYSVILTCLFVGALLEYATFDKMRYIGVVNEESVTEVEKKIKLKSGTYSYFFMLLLLFSLYFIADLRGTVTSELTVAFASAFVVLPLVEFVMKKRSGQE